MKQGADEGDKMKLSCSIQDTEEIITSILNQHHEIKFIKDLKTRRVLRFRLSDENDIFLGNLIIKYVDQNLIDFIFPGDPYISFVRSPGLKMTITDTQLTVPESRLIPIVREVIELLPIVSKEEKNLPNTEAIIPVSENGTFLSDKEDALLTQKTQRKNRPRVDAIKGVALAKCFIEKRVSHTERNACDKAKTSNVTFRKYYDLPEVTIELQKLLTDKDFYNKRLQAVTNKDLDSESQV
jgi:hypothetical protein